MPKKRANREGSIRKRKDGRWEDRYTAGNDPATGKPIHKSVLAKTQSEAKEKLKQAIAEAEKLDMSRTKSYALGAWIKLWYEVYAEPRLREKTKDYYLNYIDNHIVPELGNTPLEKLTTGLRRGELLALLWTDLDVENMTISVSKQVNRLNGELVVSQPKTPNSIRKLAIPQRAVDLLVEEHSKHPHSPHLFVSPKTGTMFDPDSFRHTHEKMLKAIGAEHIRFHDLRHTFATLSLKYGVDVKTLSGALGHYDAGFTLSTYTHATEGMKHSAADTIGSVISQTM